MLISHFAALLTLMIGVTGCVQNIREQSPDTIAQSVSYATTTKGQNGLAWIAPELHISHYRTLFYGYDTIDYRLAAKKYSTTSLSDNFVLLVDAHMAAMFGIMRLPICPIVRAVKLTIVNMMSNDAKYLTS
jgi:hypothetical protein